MTTPRVVMVAGAVSYDYLLYSSAPHADRHAGHDIEEDFPHTQLVIRPGNADLVAQLLAAAASAHGFDVLKPVLQPGSPNVLKHCASSVVDLLPIDADALEPRGYRVAHHRSIARPPIWHAPVLPPEIVTSSGTVVVSGSGESFQHIEPALDFLQRARPRYIIHHMTRPLATGVLWDFVRDGPRTRDGPPDPDFLAVILDADDLRAEGIALSHSLSWEATAEDFVRNLGSNGRLDTLVTCPNLIVRFGTQGLIHHRGRDAVDPKLYYHPREVEGGGRRGGNAKMIGVGPAFTAGFALGFANPKRPTTDRGLKYGLAAARRLSEKGFISSEIDHLPDYPIDETMADLGPDKQYVSVSIPSARISSGDRWSIFDSVTGDPAEVARKIVAIGPDRALASCPVQVFGELRSVDRSEQESLRAVIGAVQERLEHVLPRPTSIGMFGPPGAGKKFMAKNIAAHVCNDRPTQRMAFDTRLMKTPEFIAACHAVRDSNASGLLTVVVFENFEAVLDSNNPLLHSFLGIMREGRFTDNGHVHTIGAPLIFFLVNREESMTSSLGPMSPQPMAAEFGVRRSNTEEPLPLLDDLHGLIRVTGPNQQHVHDKLYSVRRALMLRQLLKEKHPHLITNDEVKVEEGVLHALLFVPTYKHGLRSLDKIISTSRLAGRNKYDVAALPPEEQIQLHVDGRIFMGYLRSPKLPPALRERLAEGLFETYKKRRVAMVKTDEERKALETDRAMQDWDELAPELKESTRAQADDIPRKLRAVNYFMLEEDRSDPLVRVHEFTTADLDLLAEMEHERFNAERLQRQWRMGPRNSKQKTTPFLIPWRDLAQEWRDVDRVMVECVPRILDKAGWRIYRMKTDEEPDTNGAA